MSGIHLQQHRDNMELYSEMSGIHLQQHSDNMELAGDPGHNRGQAVGGGRHGGQWNGRGQAPLLRGGHGPRLRGVGEHGRGQGHGPRQGQQQQGVSNEIQAKVVNMS